jgi:hypothetical protein
MYSLILLQIFDAFGIDKLFVRLSQILIIQSSLSDKNFDNVTDPERNEVKQRICRILSNISKKNIFFYDYIKINATFA